MVLTQQRIKRRDELIIIMNKTKSQNKKETCKELIEALNILIKKKKWYQKIF